jgi:hypothetical protein
MASATLRASGATATLGLPADERSNMYENYKLCSELEPSDRCLVVEQYVEGKFEQRFHQHVPKSRLSVDAVINLLRALVARFDGESGMSAEQIVSAYLNNRARTPPASAVLRIVTSYPEPGVIRYYCGANTKAWSDQVIAKQDFRTRGGDKNQTAALGSCPDGGEH